MRSRALAGAVALTLASPSGAVASFPGRDGRIAFAVAMSCPEYARDGDPCSSGAFREVVTVAPNGGELRSLVRCPGPSCAAEIGRRLTYSPDGRRLAVESWLPPTSSAGVALGQLAILPTDGSVAVRVALPGPFSFPFGWLPDGRTVAVIVPDADGLSGRAFLVGADGGPVRELIGGPRGERTWSATGSVAVSNPRGVYVSSRATRRRLILASSERVTYTAADWSPDGRRLAVLRSEPPTGLQAIITVAADGDDRRVVVRGPAPRCDLGPPAWSPSGTRIAFTAWCLDPTSAGKAVFTVRPSGKGLRRVFRVDPLIPRPGSFDPGVGPAVAWQPVRR
jgi:dipeptidyl aminopeptidase/acylaminoacyl peptidase